MPQSKPGKYQSKAIELPLEYEMETNVDLDFLSVEPTCTNRELRKLLTAVLGRAISDARGIACDEADRQNAIDFLMCDDIKGENKFSFIQICEGLDLDYKTLRKKIIDLLPELDEHGQEPKKTKKNGRPLKHIAEPVRVKKIA